MLLKSSFFCILPRAVPYYMLKRLPARFVAWNVVPSFGMSPPSAMIALREPHDRTSASRSSPPFPCRSSSGPLRTARRNRATGTTKSPIRLFFYSLDSQTLTNVTQTAPVAGGRAVIDLGVAASNGYFYIRFVTTPESDFTELYVK